MVILLVPVLTAAVWCSETTTLRKLVIAGGPEGCIYQQLGCGIARLLRDNGIKAACVSTQGSVENLRLLLDKKVDVALIQSNVIGMFIECDKRLPNAVYDRYCRDERDAEAELAYLLSLYTDVAHVIVRRGLYLSSLSDLRDKRVAIGEIESGTKTVFEDMLGAAGLTFDDIKSYAGSPKDAAEKLAFHQIDALILVTGVPNRVISTLLASGNGYIFPLKASLLRRLVRTSPYYTVAKIKAGSYPRQKREISTIGARALLAVKADFDEILGEKIVNLITDNSKVLESYLPEKFKLSASIKKKGIPCNPHGAIKDIVSLQKWTRRILSHLFLSIILLAIGYAVTFKRQKLWDFFKRHDYWRILVLIFLMLFCGGTLLYVSEHELNENFQTISGSIWSVLIYMITGFEERYPITLSGKIVAIGTMVFGAAIVALFTGTLASQLVEKKIGGRKMPGKLSGHYLICNWNERGMGVIEQLHSKLFENEKYVIVVLAEPENQPDFAKAKEEGLTWKSQNDIWEDVYLHPGDPTSEMFLRRVNVQDAEAVVVLLDPMSRGNADAKSILIVLAIRKVCAKFGKQVRITVEIENPKNVELVKHANELGGGKPELIEVISASNLQQRMLAQSTHTPGIASIYDELLSFSPDNNEIYRVSINDALVGKSFKELCKMFLETPLHQELPVIPVGVFKNKSGEHYLNPREDITLEAGDELIVIAYDEDDAEKLISKFEA